MMEYEYFKFFIMNKTYLEFRLNNKTRLILLTFTMYITEIIAIIERKLCTNK